MRTKKQAYRQCIQKYLIYNKAEFIDENCLKTNSDKIFKVAAKNFISSFEYSNSPRNNQRQIQKILFKNRRTIDDVFDFDGLSSSPGWDILLDLSRAEEDGKDVSISSACIGAGYASSTALRWLKILENMGLVTRRSDPADQRRSWVLLSPEGGEKTRLVIADFVSDTNG